MKNTASLFKSLSDETRLRILSLLANGKLCVCDLMAVLDMPQSTVSRHLATLRNAGLVDGHRNGKWMYYTLEQNLDPLREDQLQLLQDHFASLMDAQNDQEALAEFLKTKKETECNS